MTNPYEPVGSDTPPKVTSASNHFYLGGFLPLAIASIVIGGISGGLIFGFNWQSAVPVFGIPAFGWLCAIALLTFCIRNSEFTSSGRVILALLLMIPAYILYVPVCSVVSMSTTLVVGGLDYGPKPEGAIFGSAVAFFMILMTIAAIVRAVFRKRVKSQPSSLDEQV